MNIKLFTTNYSQVMNKALDMYSRQHKAIAQNVANSSDPGFKRINTDFSKALEVAEDPHLRKSNDRPITFSASEGNSSAGKNGFENEPIDLTQEMAELAEMQIRYDFVSRTLNRYYGGISSAITGKNG